MSFNCKELDYCLIRPHKLEKGKTPNECFKCMSKLLIPSEMEHIQRINDNRYLYHGTDPTSFSKILEDGFLKPNSVTHNQNYDISYEDSIYFEFKLKEVLKWVWLSEAIVIRVKKAFVPKCLKCDDISTGIRVITNRIGFLEFSLNKGKNWTKIPMKEE